MRKRIIWAVVIVILIVAAAVGTVFAIQYQTETGVFDNHDVVVATSRSATRPDPESYLLYQIYLPVTDFYSTTTSVATTELLAATPDNTSANDAADTNSANPDSTDSASATANASDSSWWLIPESELDSSVKLLAVDDCYYLDDTSCGAIFEYYTFSGKHTEDIAARRAELAADIPDFLDSSTILTFAQTGVTAMSRRMNSKLAAVGDDGTFFSSGISDFLSSFDLTHTSNESSFYANASAGSETGTPICSKPAFLDTLLDIGLDIVELTGNHNRDCGNAAAISTIDTYEANGIQIVGGGKDAESAKIPLLIDEKGTGITMLAYNLSTGGYTTGSAPGANLYNEDDFKSNVAAAKARGDFIIVDIQYYECNNYANVNWDPSCSRADSSAGDQVGFFRHLIDLGADLVVGTAAHQAQTFERWGDGTIYYGLGNLFFDQIRWEGTRISLVLGHYFSNGKLLQTRLYGTEYGNDFRPELMNEERLAWFISQLVALH